LATGTASEVVENAKREECKEGKGEGGKREEEEGGRRGGGF
jgi:hypothetical protein